MRSKPSSFHERAGCRPGPMPEAGYTCLARGTFRFMRLPSLAPPSWQGVPRLSSICMAPCCRVRPVPDSMGRHLPDQVAAAACHRGSHLWPRPPELHRLLHGARAEASFAASSGSEACGGSATSTGCLWRVAGMHAACANGSAERALPCSPVQPRHRRHSQLLQRHLLRDQLCSTPSNSRSCTKPSGLLSPALQVLMAACSRQRLILC